MLITRTARDHYQFDGSIFLPDGHIVLTDFASARRVAAQMSALRTQPVPASDVYAMSLIDEALRLVVHHFAPPALMNNAVLHADQQVGAESVTATEKKFISEFPPEAVYRGDEQVEEYLQKITNGRIKTVEELIYVFTHNANPAVNPLLDLVDDEPLEPTAYKALIASLNTFFANAGRHYFHRCVIAGHVDFIFGAGQVVFDDCDIVNTPAHDSRPDGAPLEVLKRSLLRPQFTVLSVACSR